MNSQMLGILTSGCKYAIIKKNIVMPLFLIVLASSAMGASIALYILRKFDPHTDEISNDK